MASKKTPRFEQIPNATGQLWEVWEKLGPAWSPYLKLAGLNLDGVNKETLVQRLFEPITVNFGQPGLEEFARDATRGVEPGDPARSLLYHVLASPNVTPSPEAKHQEERRWQSQQAALQESVSANAEEVYPTLGQLEIVENFIFAAKCASLDDLRQEVNPRLPGTQKGTPLAVAVFAYEYTPAIDTVHNRHADLCFSRTGISRAGNAAPNYIPQVRGFMPNSGDRRIVHVIPARFGAFLAVRKTGDPSTFGPERFQPGDKDLNFWVPLHKLFSGQECIVGLNLELEINADHLNEKIRRVHLALQSEGIDTGWNAAEMTGHPFRIKGDKLAKFCQSSGLLIPQPNPLIEPAKTDDERYVGFPVPGRHKQNNGALWLESPLGDARSNPEFVHIKHKLEENGGKTPPVYLLSPNRPVEKIVNAEEIDPLTKDPLTSGGYVAANFVDYTADGWISAKCPALIRKLPELAKDVPANLSAFSVIGQPDFFPLVRQQDLIEWSEHLAPAGIKDSIWPSMDSRPVPLSDSRLPANITLKNANFDSSDRTISAIVGLDRTPAPAGAILQKRPHRESTLSWRATNVFAPGFDTSEDFNRDKNSMTGTFYLASYGLGSPYAADTLICASTGAFWPGAVPDITRFFPPNSYPSTTPFNDEDSRGLGVAPPQKRGGGKYEYSSPYYADYVKLILDGDLSYENFASTTLDEYVERTLIMARVHQAFGLVTQPERTKLAVLSFRKATEEQLANLREASGISLKAEHAYYLECALLVGKIQPVPPDKIRVSVPLQKTIQVFADENIVAQSTPSGVWDVRHF